MLVKQHVLLGVQVVSLILQANPINPPLRGFLEKGPYNLINPIKPAASTVNPKP